MKKCKSILLKSLYIELFLAVIVSFLVGFVCYLFLNKVSEKIAYSEWAKTNYATHKINIFVDELQTYIYEHQISSKDPESLNKLNQWYNDHPLYFFYIKMDDIIVYNSFIYEDNYEDVEAVPSSDEDFRETLSVYQDFLPERSARDIRLSNGEGTVFIYSDIKYSLFNNLSNLSIIISALIIILMVIYFVRIKLHYIKDITTGINILEGGNLEYQIPLRGNDELSHVAESLNSMRIALSQQMENEKKALQANNSLVTALSHDLRTPLTTQMGYLEILKGHHYKSPEEMDKYIDTAIHTCQQIKEMSDRLFEYFLAFDPHPERPDEALEVIDGVPLFMQLFSELSLPLESQGFSFEIEEPDESFTIHVNMDDVLRIFNNIFTNIDKYADERQPVRVKFIHDDSFAIVSISNKVRHVPRKNESAKIGLISISSLMRRQGGYSKTKVARDTFTLELKFPTYD